LVEKREIKGCIKGKLTVKQSNILLVCGQEGGIQVKGKDGDKTGVSRLGVGAEEYGI
jgi:hypothetical protein